MNIFKNQKIYKYKSRFIDIWQKIKRTSDFFFSLLALFILLPIFFAISLLIILDDGLPIFFVQRIGYKNRVLTYINLDP